jgi:hypothetical protein
VARPAVPVESGGHVLPPADTGAVGTVVAEGAAKSRPARDQASRQERAMGGVAMATPAPAAPPAPPPPAQMETAAAAEEATQIAFTAPYKVSVAAGQSLVLPLLDRELPARRIDLYQLSVDRQHPLAAIELTNKSETGLPPGVLTLYQQNAGKGALYLGDARLAALPAGDKRLLSYAVDGKVMVDRTSVERRPLITATVADGVMHVSRVLRSSTSYRVKAAAAPPPPLLIEQPRRPGATLTQPDPKTVELTALAYRIPLTLPASGEGGITVVEDQPVEETIRLLDIDDARLGALVSSGELDPKVRQALSEIAARRQAVGQQRAELGRQKEQRAQLVEDQNRLRNNLAVLGNDAALKKRLLDKFSETETAIETVSAAIAKETDALAAAERDLASYIGRLTL